MWNAFVAASKNGTFLFDRNYLEYHSDRFVDGSMMVYEGESLVALVPGNIDGDRFVSHGGLTFGGVVSDRNMRQGTMLAVFDLLLGELRRRDIQTVLYKPVPHIYHRLPAEEDLYALFVHGAKLTRRDVSSTVAMNSRPSYTTERKRGVAKAAKGAIEIRRSERFAEFMRVEEENLASKHGVKPVHTTAEILLLASRFPDNLKLYEASRGNELLAGVIIYETAEVAHVQYSATAPAGRNEGAFDGLIDHLFRETYAHKRYFDFGISTEQGGRFFNEGLARNKEGFGGRAVMYDAYEIRLA